MSTERTDVQIVYIIGPVLKDADTDRVKSDFRPGDRIVIQGTVIADNKGSRSALEGLEVVLEIGGKP